MSQHLTVGDRVRRIEIVVPKREAKTISQHDRRVLVSISHGTIRAEAGGWAYKNGNEVAKACIERLRKRGFVTVGEKDGARFVGITQDGRRELAEVTKQYDYSPEDSK